MNARYYPHRLRWQARRHAAKAMLITFGLVFVAAFVLVALAMLTAPLWATMDGNDPDLLKLWAIAGAGGVTCLCGGLVLHFWEQR